MNLAIFDVNCKEFLNVCYKANSVIRSEKKFPYELRTKLDRVLRNVLHLLREDKSSSGNKISTQYIDIAHQIVYLDKIQKITKTILRNIYTLPGRRYFNIIISKKFIPVIDKKIDSLKSIILSQARLPFIIGNKRFEFLNKVKSSIECVQSSNIKELHLEYFHLLGDDVERNNLLDLNVSSLEGILEIYGLMSWGKIIQLFIKNNPEQAEKGNRILDKINKAIPFATKLSFAYENLHSVANFSSVLPYYQDLVNTFDPHFCSQRMHLIDFFNKYNLDNIFSVPLDVLKNEMTWDMIKSIYAMKQGEEQIFLLGSCKHRLAVQITCMALDIPGQQEGLYKYEIFNTGNGYLFHKTKKEGQKIFALPITYHNVPLGFLSYEFFSYLIDHALRQPLISDFYHWHEKMFAQKGGLYEDFNSGAWYETQHFGTCSFKSLEANIKSSLNPKQRQLLELTKTQIAVQKQRNVVIILEKDINPIERNTPNCQTLIKINQLKEGRLLLDLGEKYLAKLCG